MSGWSSLLDPELRTGCRLTRVLGPRPVCGHRYRTVQSSLRRNLNLLGGRGARTGQLVGAYTWGHVKTGVIRWRGYRKSVRDAHRAGVNTWGRYTRQRNTRAHRRTPARTVLVHFHAA